MKKVVKIFTGIGILLFVIGMAGRTITLTSTASAVQTAHAESTPSEQTLSKMGENRKKRDIYMWIAFAGSALVIGSRIGLKIKGDS
jgi:anionic cell wall polymer biosynthesis LytR-Cps2A-Psr (LCP) family protein